MDHHVITHGRRLRPACCLPPPAPPAPGERAHRPPQARVPALSFTRRSELISKIYVAVVMMGNDHIMPLRTGDALAQRRAPALG